MKIHIKPNEIKYIALFVDNPEKLLEMFPAKHRKVFAHHSTIWHRPTSTEGLEIGKKSMLKIIGEAHDEKSFALLVESSRSKNSFAHITISCAEGTRPVYSNELFEKASKDGSLNLFDDPFFIEVTEGCVNMNNRLIISEN